MNLLHLRGFKTIFIGIVIPILGALMIGASFLPLGSTRDVLLAVGGAFVGQITSLAEYISESKNKISEATKRARTAFLLGWDLSIFFILTTSYSAEDLAHEIDRSYERVASELEVLGLHTAEDLLGLLKEFRELRVAPGRPMNDAFRRKFGLALDQTKEILAHFDPPLNYVFVFGLEFSAGQVMLRQADVKEGEKILQLLEGYSKNIRSIELYGSFSKEVIDKAIKIFTEELENKRRGEFNISDLQKAQDFINEEVDIFKQFKGD